MLWQTFLADRDIHGYVDTNKVDGEDRELQRIKVKASNIGLLCYMTNKVDIFNVLKKITQIMSIYCVNSTKSKKTDFVHHSAYFISCFLSISYEQVNIKLISKCF